MLCDAVEFVRVRSLSFKKGAMNEEVSIAPYRRGKVDVMVLGQSEMTLGPCRVACPWQGAE